MPFTSATSRKAGSSSNEPWKSFTKKIIGKQQTPSGRWPIAELSNVVCSSVGIMPQKKKKAKPREQALPEIENQRQIRSMFRRISRRFLRSRRRIGAVQQGNDSLGYNLLKQVLCYAFNLYIFNWLEQHSCFDVQCCESDCCTVEHKTKLQQVV